MKNFLLTLIFLCFGLLANAQNSTLKTSLTIGPTVPILDGGIGFHIGINPSYPLHANFSIEGQISYLYTKINSSFLSGKEGHMNSVNTLVGGRLYLNAAEKTNRFYLNLLIGGRYNKEELDGQKKEGTFNGGFSGGGFLELNKFLIGLSYDTPQNLVLKMGYVF